MVTTDKIVSNGEALEKELRWLTEVINTRLKLYFQEQADYSSIYEIEPVQYDEDDHSMFAEFVRHYRMSIEERIVLLLSLVPHIQPQLLDVFFFKNPNKERGYSEFGGIQGHTHGGFLPTGETALFILAGNNLEPRFSYHHIFEGDHFFARHGILELRATHGDEPFLSGALVLLREYVDLFTTGRQRKPNFSSEFPARLITTEMEWSDLVLESTTMRLVEEVKAWADYGETLLHNWGLKKSLKPGFVALFNGPSGTGKTLTASLLGKLTNRDVYKIDLSMVISKYIGETEKNLSRIFDQAENKDWILFFDEADALFGKRTKVENAHDRFANQEVSFLLQRIEEFKGIAILCSNFKSNLDDAFTRRIQSIIHFPIPGATERYKLWVNSFSTVSELEDKIDLKQIAEKYELTGGSIVNVVRYASLMAIKRNSNLVLLSELSEGIRKEFQKEGRSI